MKIPDAMLTYKEKNLAQHKNITGTLVRCNTTVTLNAVTFHSTENTFYI